ncbi:MAG: DUF421 domain-containing protein [Clostridia bacterium]|nr:DUF421 domain-containing protein [Clostridia bacterium]
MVTIFLRTVIIYLLLIFSMRLMGKRQIGELDLFDLITTLLISELASLPITDSSIPLSHAIIPIITLVTFEVVTSFLLVYFPRLKNILSTRPAVLVRKGQPDRSAMLKSRISADELMSELRQKDVTDISEVEYAILEQNGKITVIQKAPFKTPNAAALGIKSEESGIYHIVVCEGVINKNSLKSLGMSQEELLQKLKASSVPLKSIYIMLINDAKETKIIKKER